jgi:hypothetical protein
MKMNNLVKTIGIFRAKSSQDKDPQRAEKAWRLSQYVEAGAEYPNLRLTGDKQADGLWVCHCRHENKLIHYAGPHPFKHLRCGKCEHIMCEFCPTSAIMTPLKQVTANTLKLPDSQPMFAWVCQHCGLSHRATASECATHCACGYSLKDCSRGYHIGSIVGYRRDPEGTAVTLSLQGRHTATKNLVSASNPAFEPMNFSRPFRAQEPVLTRNSSEPEMWEIGLSPLKEILMSRPSTHPRAASGSNSYGPAEFDDDWTDEELEWFYYLR